VDGFPASVHAPGALSGFAALLGTIVAVLAVAIVAFRRADVTA
jgi:hypothetical protein